jgi:hypothetical protein
VGKGAGDFFNLNFNLNFNPVCARQVQTPWIGVSKGCVLIDERSKATIFTG